MSTNKTPPKSPAEKTDLATDLSLSSASPERQYAGPTLTFPVFGRIPLKPSEILRDLKIKDNPPLWAQFFKYGVCGVIATAVLTFVWVLARIYIPDYIADDLPPETLKLNMAYVMVVAFIIANLVAYFSNRIFVFTPGKHSFLREMFLFFLISAISFTAGNFAKDWFIDNGLHKDFAIGAFAVSSALVNFVARKYLVFSNTSEPNSKDAVSPT